MRLLLDNGAGPRIRMDDGSTIANRILEYGKVFEPILDIPDLDLE